MSVCKKAKVPMAPTIYCKKSTRSAQKLLDDMVSRGWKEFVIKLSFSAFSLGFMKCTVARCQKNPKVLEKYFEEYVPHVCLIFFSSFAIRSLCDFALVC